MWFRSSLARLILLLLVCLTSFPEQAKADKLLSLASVRGARDNQLIGYGVITGLNGTGDDTSVPFAQQSLIALLRRLGVQVEARQVRLKNVAAVLVTATIPAFAKPGTKLDVTVSSIGNAKSLLGGVLVQTPLRGANRRTYAVAQGPLIIGGFSASGSSGSVTTNITTTGRIPNGALVEREVAATYSKGGVILLTLREPDFTTAQRAVDAVNKAFGKDTATALDGGEIRIKSPKKFDKRPVALLAALAEVEVVPGEIARVVINERTGTIVAGGDVRLRPVAISQGGITIAVKDTPKVSQPGALAAGETKTVKETELNASEKAPPALTYVSGASTLADVAKALSTFGVTPRELASILQALKSAGALRAEVVVQ